MLLLGIVIKLRIVPGMDQMKEPITSITAMERERNMIGQRFHKTNIGKEGIN